LYVGGALLGVIVLLGGLTAVFWSQIARVLVERAATSRGIDLKAKDVSLSLSSAHLTDVDAKLASAPGLKLHAESIDVDLSWFSPKQLHVHKLEIEADEPRALVGFISAPPGARAAGIPSDADHLSLHVKKISNAIPIAIDLTADKATHEGANTTIAGVRGAIPISGAPFGPYSLALVRDGSTTTATTPSLPNVKIAVDREAHTVSLLLDKTPILATASAHPVSASGKLTIDIPEASEDLVFRGGRRDARWCRDSASP